MMSDGESMFTTKSLCLSSIVNNLVKRSMVVVAMPCMAQVSQLWQLCVILTITSWSQGPVDCLIQTEYCDKFLLAIMDG